MATEATRRTVPGGVIDELLSSPGVLLALLGQDAMRRMRDVHTAHELSPRQFQVLGLLHDHGAMGQRELGQAIGVAPSILVTLLNPLEAAGHVSRDRDAGDRRRHVVTLTPAGRRHLAAAARAQREAEDELFAALTTEQRDQLRDLLIVLRGEGGCEPREPGCELAEQRLG